MRDKTQAPMLLEFACSQRWQEMTGDERARHCAQCNQQVINISDYSQAQINELQERIDCGEKICVAFKPVKPEPAAALGEWLPFAFPESSLGIAGLLACSLTLCCFSGLAAGPVYGQEKSQQELPLELDWCEWTQDFPYWPRPFRNGKLVGSPPGKQAPVSDMWEPRSETQKVYVSSETDIVLANDEHGLWLGMPAPNAVRDLVNDVVYEAGDFFDFLPSLLRKTIRRQVRNEGRINIPKIELLAAFQENHGNVEQAFSSYRLLLVLAERQSASPERKEVLRKKLEALAPAAYRRCLEAALEGSSPDDYSVTKALNEALKIREFSESSRKLCTWKELAACIDSIAERVKEGYVASLALQVSAEEPVTPALEKWRQKYIDLAVADFKQSLIKARRKLADGSDDSVLAVLNSVKVPEDIEAARLCDIDALLAIYLEELPKLDRDHRYIVLGHCVYLVEAPTYHSKNDKNKKELCEFLKREVGLLIVLSWDDFRKGLREEAASRLWEAHNLANYMPPAIPENLWTDIREQKVKLNLAPGDSNYF